MRHVHLTQVWEQVVPGRALPLTLSAKHMWHQSFNEHTIREGYSAVLRFERAAK